MVIIANVIIVSFLPLKLVSIIVYIYIFIENISSDFAITKFVNSRISQGIKCDKINMAILSKFYH